MGSDRRREIGRRGEDLAARRLERLGYTVIERNYRTRAGEIDLIAERSGTLVFCEVKTRRGPSFGGGYEAVTWRKRAKIRSLAEAFLQERGDRSNAIRFDVASVSLGQRGPHVELFEDAF